MIKIKSYIIFILVGILAIFQIIISNRLSGYGRKISLLAQQSEQLKLENERVKKKIASFSALTNINQRAKEAGFTQKAQVYYLDDLYSVAQNSL